jgi:hypothetical protein
MNNNTTYCETRNETKHKPINFGMKVQEAIFYNVKVIFESREQKHLIIEF